ncbi:MAG: UDP-N-acetylmuramoyl-L-alanine--D-glutamate ligase [Burkholderiaceae bacterium]
MNAPASRPLSLPESEADWVGLNTLVLGAGESGQACARWLSARGAQVTLVDSRAMSRPDLDATIAFESGMDMPFSKALLEGRQLVVVSPGLSPYADRAASVANLVLAAQAQGIPLASELDLFEWALDALGCEDRPSEADEDAPELALGRPAVVAVTGTNGKTTTAVLTAKLLESTGLDVQLAGNVSPSMLTALLARQASGRLPQVWVLELSSFQLTWSHRFRPTASAILNLSDDHLDWHLDRAEYASAKLRILGLPVPQGRVLAPREDADLYRAMQARGGARIEAFWSFGRSPLEQGATGLGLLMDGIEWIVMRRDAQAPIERLMPAAALRLVGSHNRLNVMAALGLALAVRDDLAPMLHTLRAYAGEPHRLTPVRTVAGVEFINDSKGTNVGATIAALADGDFPLAVILGGEGKGQNFEPLAQALKARGACAVGVGRDGPQILERAGAHGAVTLAAETLERAVPLAFSWVQQRLAETGRSYGQVLLSPACASFDQFQNYAHRGDCFTAQVEQCAQDQGGQV